MSEQKRYAVDPESLQAYRIRVLFHCEELQKEADPTNRATIALCLAEAATTLARLEAEAARRLSSVLRETA